MPQTILCPGCKEPLSVSQSQCGICLRSLSPREIARILREQSPEYIRRKFLRSVGLKMLVGGTATLLFAIVGTRAGWIPKGRMTERFEAILYRKPKAPVPQPLPAPPTPPPFNPPAPLPPEQMPPPAPELPPLPAQEGEVRYKINDQGFIDIGPNKPGRGSGPLPGMVKVKSPPKKNKSVDKRWVVSGTIYDLLTLKPVPSVRIRFSARGTGRMHSTRTDTRGRYALKLPALGPGYDVDIRHPYYGEVYLEEGSPAYKTRTIERRREERDIMYSVEIVHLPLMLEGKKRTVRHDLVVASP
jgi:hypothetical protein